MALPSRVSWELLPAGDLGIGQTLQAMRRIVMGAVRDPFVVHTARQIIAGVPERDTRGEVETIFAWVQDHLRYTHDPTTYELVTTPQYALREIRSQGHISEDCDSAAVLLAALLEAVGVRTRFHVLGSQPPRAGDSRFSHVYVEAEIGGRWVPLDATVRGQPPGIRPRGFGREAIYEGEAMHYTLDQTPGIALGQVPEAPPTSTGIWGDVVGVIKAGAQSVLPLLERYGVLQPRLGPARLPLPGEPRSAYAVSLLPAGIRQFATTTAPWLPWAIGAGVLGVVLWRGWGRRR